MIDIIAHFKAHMEELIMLVIGFITLTTLDHALHAIYRRLEARHTNDAWTLWLKAAKSPLRWGLWALGILTLTHLLSHRWWPNQPWPYATIMHITTLSLITWLLVRSLGIIENRRPQTRSSRMDPSTLHTLCRLSRFIVIAMAILISLDIAGVPLSGVWTFGGVGGIGVALAAKDLLANLFGGLMIFLDRPFTVGDWIRSPTADIEGTVEHIGWRLTRIRTFDKRARYVPNYLFSTLVIDNPSRMTHRRIKTSIGIRYDDVNVARLIVKDVETMLRNHPAIDERQTLMVYVDELASSSVNFFIYCFTHTTKWVEFQEILQDVLLMTNDIISQHGASCAFPSRSLYLVKGKDESPEEP